MAEEQASCRKRSSAYFSNLRFSKSPPAGVSQRNRKVTRGMERNRREKRSRFLSLKCGIMPLSFSCFCTSLCMPFLSYAKEKKRFGWLRRTVCGIMIAQSAIRHNEIVPPRCAGIIPEIHGLAENAACAAALSALRLWYQRKLSVGGCPENDEIRNGWLLWEGRR